MAKRFFVYVLANRPKGVLYVGVTSDLSRRVWQHKAKAVPGFTNRYGIARLIYYEEHASILEARERERVQKRWRRAWKFTLIEASIHAGGTWPKRWLCSECLSGRGVLSDLFPEAMQHEVLRR